MAHHDDTYEGGRPDPLDGFLRQAQAHGLKGETQLHAEVRAAIIGKVVDRFLCWKLPSDFAPDCHISFKLPDPVLNPNPSWPVGTNLFTADQARQMLEHLLAPYDLVPKPVESAEGTKDG